MEIVQQKKRTAISFRIGHHRRGLARASRRCRVAGRVISWAINQSATNDQRSSKLQVLRVTATNSLTSANIELLPLWMQNKTKDDDD